MIGGIGVIATVQRLAKMNVSRSFQSLWIVLIGMIIVGTQFQGWGRFPVMGILFFLHLPLMLFKEWTQGRSQGGGT